MATFGTPGMRQACETTAIVQLQQQAAQAATAYQPCCVCGQPTLAEAPLPCYACCMRMADEKDAEVDASLPDLAMPEFDAIEEQWEEHDMRAIEHCAALETRSIESYYALKQGEYDALVGQRMMTMDELLRDRPVPSGSELCK